MHWHRVWLLGEKGTREKYVFRIEKVSESRVGKCVEVETKVVLANDLVVCSFKICKLFDAICKFSGLASKVFNLIWDTFMFSEF